MKDFKTYPALARRLFIVITTLVVFFSMQPNNIDAQSQTNPPITEDDTDGDGLPDVWEMMYFGTLIYGAGDNNDGDELNNLAEFQQGRDPTVKDDPRIGLVVFTPVR